MGVCLNTLNKAGTSNDGDGDSANLLCSLKLEWEESLTYYKHSSNHVA